jgi:DNA (cytosine-5)-methyltransferase 1
MKQNGHTNPRVVDLFAGAGGLSCGLAMAGFDSIAAVEMTEAYASTYVANHPDAKVFVEDIRGLARKDLCKILGVKRGELDLLAGGPPCQGFSINAPIRSLDDPRNHLFKDYMTFVEKLRPQAVLLENVTGIISLGQGTVVQQIYKELTSLGYSVAHRILFAAHYGVPQIRYRTIVLAIRGVQKQVEFPQPTHYAEGVANFTQAKTLCIPIDPLFAQHLRSGTTVADAIFDLPPVEAGITNGPLAYATPARNDYQRLLRRGSRKACNHHGHRIAPINLERLKHIPQGGSWRDIPVRLLPAGLKRARRSDHTKRYGRLAPDGMCSTILTKCDPHWGSFFHPLQDRVLTVREAARIQSFPDTFHFLGSVGEQYAQVGNAVPPLLARAVGLQILKMTARDERSLAA